MVRAHVGPHIHKSTFTFTASVDFFILGDAGLRIHCTSKGIKTDFIPKGRKTKDYKANQVLRKAISKERSTRLEVSFGKDKAHYHLRKVNARTKKNEIIWICFFTVLVDFLVWRCIRCKDLFKKAF